MADVQSGQPIDPDRSLVRIASITKLFTATAVMQQVAAGRLDLAADVNSYLTTTCTIPSVDGDHVTLENLLDHTAGFEERSVGVGARSADQVAPLETFLATDMPARIRPAGQISAYSNYGAGLAGQIVASVTGQSWGDYVRATSWIRWGCGTPRRSSRSRPRWPTDAAHSYDWTDGGYQEIPFIFDRLPTGRRDQLDGRGHGRLHDRPPGRRKALCDNRLSPVPDAAMLDPTTLALMHQRSFSANPDLDGYAHGFRERTIAGHRALTHDGSWEGFESLLLLVPDSDLGLFVSTNSTGGIELVTDLLDRFTGRFLTTQPRPVTTSGAAATATRPTSAGYYQPARHNETSLERILTPFNTTRLSIDGSTVTFQGRPWDQIGPLLYQDRAGGQRLALVSVPDGTRYVATDGAAYQLVPSHGHRSDESAGAAGAGVGPAGRARRCRSSRWSGGCGSVPRRSAGGLGVVRRLAIVTTAVGLGFVVLLFGMLAGDTSEYVYGLASSFGWLLVLPLVFLVLTAGTIGLTVSVLGVRQRRAVPGAPVDADRRDARDHLVPAPLSSHRLAALIHGVRQQAAGATSAGGLLCCAGHQAETEPALPARPWQARPAARSSATPRRPWQARPAARRMALVDLTALGLHVAGSGHPQRDEHLGLSQNFLVQRRRPYLQSPAIVNGQAGDGCDGEGPSAVDALPLNHCQRLDARRHDLEAGSRQGLGINPARQGTSRVRNPASEPGVARSGRRAQPGAGQHHGRSHRRGTSALLCTYGRLCPVEG